MKLDIEIENTTEEGKNFLNVEAELENTVKSEVETADDLSFETEGSCYS